MNVYIMIYVGVFHCNLQLIALYIYIIISLKLVLSYTYIYVLRVYHVNYIHALMYMHVTALTKRL